MRKYFAVLMAAGAFAALAAMPAASVAMPVDGVVTLRTKPASWGGTCTPKVSRAQTGKPWRWCFPAPRRLVRELNDHAPAPVFVAATHPTCSRSTYWWWHDSWWHKFAGAGNCCGIHYVDIRKYSGAPIYYYVVYNCPTST